jgi:hypothetical protein
MADSGDCGRGGHFELKIGGGGLSLNMRYLLGIDIFRDIRDTIHR